MARYYYTPFFFRAKLTVIDRLRDILYFDLEKAASLISQIEGGLAQSRTEGSEAFSDTRNVRRYDLLKVFNAEFGGIDSVKKTILETKVLHHDLLIRLEETLFSLGFATDVNNVEAQTSLEATRQQIVSSAYLRAKGWCALEDFDRIYEVTNHFNDLMGFIQRSVVEKEAGKDALHERLKALDLNGKSNTKEYKDCQAQFREVEKLTKKKLEWAKLPEELFQGIRCWIDTLV